MTMNLEISVDLHHINEDRKDEIPYETLQIKDTLSKSGIYFLCKKYETTGSIENKRGRGRKPKKSAREDFMIVRLAQKKNDISLREFVEDLKLNASALTMRFRIKNPGLVSCIQRKNHTS
ncbi:hypothetical protein AVEN_219362-1 [Araneus ventricosus]|uniref:Uncharacterized protein n=1 Tax=Araneus ventricosus TaxID=182803 RepID=A0A4Y2BF77_ARAVE|nr:hypothetical protein AVEN_219362-1 [Araneus ventricosus]